MGWPETRIQSLEDRYEWLYRRLVQDEAILTNVRQQLRGAFQQLPAGGGSGDGVGYFACITTGDLPAGTPGTPLPHQTVWRISGGARVNTDTDATLYNDTPIDIPSGSQVLVGKNDDATWSAVGVACAGGGG
jgi:hypothetical protein